MAVQYDQKRDRWSPQTIGRISEIFHMWALLGVQLYWNDRLALTWTNTSEGKGTAKQESPFYSVYQLLPGPSCLFL